MDAVKTYDRPAHYQCTGTCVLPAGNFKAPAQQLLCSS
jgi:hypothetical protein